MRQGTWQCGTHNAVVKLIYILNAPASENIAPKIISSYARGALSAIETVALLAKESLSDPYTITSDSRTRHSTTNSTNTASRCLRPPDSRRWPQFCKPVLRAVVRTCGTNISPIQNKAVIYILPIFFRNQRL